MIRRVVSIILPILIVIACMLPALAEAAPGNTLTTSLTRVIGGSGALSATLLSSVVNNDAVATTMRLRKAEGEVSVSNKEGKPSDVRERMLLYDGYGIGTQKKSYAWIDLDTKKLIKLD